MSENQTEAPVFQDQMHEMQFSMLSDLINKRNDLVGKANAAKGDRQTLTEQIRDNSTDPDIVAAREAYSEALLALDALVKPEVERIIADAEGASEGIEAEIAELDKTLKPGVTFFKKVYGEESAKHFPSQSRLTGAATVRSGAGGRRVRGFNVIVTIDGESVEFENFASAAKHLDVETADLQSAFFTKAGTETLKDVPDEVNMTIDFTETDADGNESSKQAFVKAYRTEPTGTTAAEPEATQSEVEVSDEDLEAL